MNTFSKMTAVFAFAALVAAPMNVEAKRSNKRKCYVAAATVVGFAALAGAAYYFRDDITGFYNQNSSVVQDKCNAGLAYCTETKDSFVNWVTSFWNAAPKADSSEVVNPEGSSENPSVENQPEVASVEQN